MEVDENQQSENDDVTIIENTPGTSEREKPRGLQAIAPKPLPVMLRRSIPGHKLLPARFITSTGHPGFMNAWRMLKKTRTVEKRSKRKRDIPKDDVLPS